MNQNLINLYNYTNFSCRIIDYSNSALLSNRDKNSKKLNTLFIGDSIGGQHAIAAKCATEREKLDFMIDKLSSWAYLRNDYPCSYKCANSSYRAIEHVTCANW